MYTRYWIRPGPLSANSWLSVDGTVVVAEEKLSALIGQRMDLVVWRTAVRMLWLVEAWQIELLLLQVDRRQRSGVHVHVIRRKLWLQLVVVARYSCIHYIVVDLSCFN